MPTNKSGSARFPKAEKLCSRTQTEQLFAERRSVFLYPFKVLFLPTSAEQHFPKVLISVPKRRFRRAVDRNRIKRLIREVYRLEKEAGKAHLMGINALAIVYVGKEELPLAYLRKRWKKILVKLAEQKDATP